MGGALKVVLSAAVMMGWVGATAQASASEVSAPRDASAAVRGIDLTVFGSSFSISSIGAAIADDRRSRADAEGVAQKRGTTSSAQADAGRRRQAVESCEPELDLLELLEVKMACGESRAQLLPELLTTEYPVHLGASLIDHEEAKVLARPKVVDNGGPQAVGRASVAVADIRDVRPLRPATEEIRSLLDSVSPVADQAVSSATGAVGPGRAGLLGSLSANMGLRPTDSVRPVTTMLAQLVEGIDAASGLMSIKPSQSTVTTNTTEKDVVALARSGGGQLDLLPGAGVGGAPLLSIVFGEVMASSAFDRSAATHTSTFDPGLVRIQLNRPLLGEGVTALEVRPDAPVTLLEGTPLETTISAGGGKRSDRSTGSDSVADGAKVQMLRGLRGTGGDGIDLRLGRAEAATGDAAAEAGPGTTAIAGETIQPRPAGKPDLRPLIVAAGLALAANLAVVARLARHRRRRAVPTTSTGDRP